MRVHHLLAIVVTAAALTGCGGGKGGGAPEPTPTALKFSVDWAARSRALSGPGSALSVVVSLRGAGPSHSDLALSPAVNRDTTRPEAHRQEIVTANAVRPGLWPLHAEFHAQPDGAGDIVGTVDANVTIQADGTGIGDLATQGQIGAVEVTAPPALSIGVERTLAFTVRDRNDPGRLLALSPGSAAFQVVSGAERLQVSPAGACTPLSPGEARVTATVDGVASAPQTIRVDYPGGGVLQAMMVAGSDGSPVPVATVAGAIPAGTAPAPQLAGSSTQTVRGGTLLLQIEAPAGIEAILVAVDGQSDYLRADLHGDRSAPASRALPADACAPLAAKYAPRRSTRATRTEGVLYNAVLSVPAELTRQAFTLQVATLQNGQVSQIATQNIGVNAAAQASNTLQINMSWTAPVDLDLHVQTPDGGEIGYDSRTGQNGGTLDLDSNPACHLDNANSENITWTAEAPAAGVYVIRPNLWSGCDASGVISYTIRVNNEGDERVYQGSFNASEANRNAGTPESKLLYIAVLPPARSDAGVLARTLIAESQTPGSTNAYNASEVKRGMQAMKAAIENRLHDAHPEWFGAPGAQNYADIVTAPGQFAGISKGGDNWPVYAADLRVRIRDAKLKPNLPVWSPARYREYLGNVLAVVDGPVSDPFAQITAIDGVAVTGGTYGWRTAGSSTSGLGNLLVIPPAQGGTIAGNYFLALKK